MNQPPPTKPERRPRRTPLWPTPVPGGPPDALFVGIDVSQEWVDAAVVDARGNLIRAAQRYDNRAPGFQRLWEETEALGTKFSANLAYAMEASGIYHHNLLVFLLGRTERVWSFNPLLLKKERHGDLRKTKTDALDAEMVAQFARKEGAQHPFSTCDPEQMHLRELGRVRFRLVRKVTRAKQQLRRNLDLLCPALGAELSDVGSPSSLAVLKAFAQVTKLFTATVEEIEKTLVPFYHDVGRRHLKAVALQKRFAERLGSGGLEDPLTWEVRFLVHQLELLGEQIRQVEGKIEREMERRKSLLQTIPGVGLVTAAIVEGELGDPHRFPDEHAVRAFAGLDPSVRESGKFEGTQRHISKRGSPRLREAVYSAALPATRVNPACQEMYDRLRNAGKEHRVALVAVAGKLLVQCWAVLRNGRSFELPEKYRTEGEEGGTPARAEVPLPEKGEGAPALAAPSDGWEETPRHPETGESPRGAPPGVPAGRGGSGKRRREGRLLGATGSPEKSVTV